jgi:hypothetical protein
LREEHRLRVFEKRVLRMIFGLRGTRQRSREDCINEDLYDPYSSNVFWVIK